MAILRAFRSSRTVVAVVLLGSFGLVGTAGAFGACGERETAGSAAADSTATPARTPTYAYDVVASYPHDPAAFTQGLQWHDGRLFESTGQVGTS